MTERIDPPEPEDKGLSVDEKFARMVAELDGTRLNAPGVKEEAARTRQLRAEWSKNPPKAVAWRADGPSTLDSPPASGAAAGAGGTASHWDDAGAGRRRRRLGKPIGIAVLLTLLGLAGWVIASYDPKPAPVDATPAGTAKPWLTGAAVAAASPAPSQSFASPDDRYFAGSPAVDWADNAAGFTVPAAAKLNGVSAQDMASGYAQLVQVMAAGNLDATILDGGPVTDFTTLLDPQSKVPAQLESWIAHPTYQNDPTMLVTRFNPAATRLLGHTVKVHGVMTAAAGPHPGSALLTADYVFVYAVTTPAGAGADDTRVAVHRTVQLEVMNPDDYVVTPGKAWVYDYAADLANIECYKYDGYIDPGFTGALAPNMTGVADPYATGNLLTASAQPQPSGTTGACQAESGY